MSDTTTTPVDGLSLLLEQARAWLGRYVEDEADDPASLAGDRAAEMRGLIADLEQDQCGDPFEVSALAWRLQDDHDAGNLMAGVYGLQIGTCCAAENAARAAGEHTAAAEIARDAFTMLIRVRREWMRGKGGGA